MATYVLIHGAGDASYWQRLVPELRGRGHDVVAPELPSDDDAGLAGYTDTVLSAIGDRTDLVVVAQSLGGFTGPLVCDRVPVRLLVMLCAMVPTPGETAGDWWGNTGSDQARREQAVRDGRSPEFDVVETFFHDVPPEIVAEATAREPRNESASMWTDPWPLQAWPDVPTRFLLGRDDRFFPASFLRRVVRDRLGIVPDEMDGGHCPALSRPKDLADRLEAYLLEESAG
ncbi:alpha/beta hydrolase [Actinoallomurus iriomotensis]|uniref:Alpha/beta hydrolase n=1 Tax=Actinoallomurus iriomotensis TaxID=478107 RepID=A0A9W6SAG3_9ACTN|nr:alpha/beta hydrolase [Actinoallomurus iriomotensis]GLY90061.1 alpha/beta hydrolase [Actinoallomurus iriomotensis]